MTLSREGVGGLVLGSDVFFGIHSDQIVALAARYAIPTMYPIRAGGLISLGTDVFEVYRQIGRYTGRILRDEQPANLPVQQVTKLLLVINMKTANALGLSFPRTLLARADEVIE